MKRVLCIAVLTILTFGLVIPTSAAPTPSADVLPNELIVKLQPHITLSPTAHANGPDTSQLNTLLSNTRAVMAQSLGHGSASYRIQVEANTDPYVLARQLATHPAVVYAEPNHTRTLMRTPNDTVVNRQWPLRNISAFGAWDITTGSDIVIALLDTGVSSTHPDLSNKLLPGYDFFNNDSDATDDEGHGTHTAGVAAADSNNNEGIAGVCWGCRILPVKVLGPRGEGDDATIAAGIRWAVDQGARVISMSLGGPDDTQVLRDAVNYARERNVLIIAASGNNNNEGNLPNYPAAYPNVLAVTATGGSDVVTGFSTVGDFVGIAAPGVGVWSTLWDRNAGDTYGMGNGTSAAAPHVAGAAGLVLSIRPDLSADQLMQILQASADDQGPPGRDEETGYGRLNVQRAVTLAGDPNVLNQSRIEGFISGNQFEQSVVSLNTGQQTQPDANGFYLFTDLPTGSYMVEARWPDGQTSQQGAWVSGTSLSVANIIFEQGPSPTAPANPAPVDAAPIDASQAFLPVAQPSDPNVTYFPQTQHTLRGTIRSYWEANGGLPIFGYPISEEFVERGEDGQDYVVQYFERHRLEIHPENPPPYNVLLGRIGDTILQQNGRSWFDFPAGSPQPNCEFFEETQHSLCGEFLNYWRSSGLELDGLSGKTRDESLALFGAPISEPQIEVLGDGNEYVVQWFERARFEFHEGQGVLLGLLGNDLAASR
ncbi:MAG: peptidase S8 [Chloroflexi bacterium AL-W]|nr:peptidase S8 [Chloroflexi bacterium AL-N1]NOK65483.1 peptidase S8 [Chloroflexi bacterium AL-N10]NOK72251.1 peptidase S8 [Chloroflexi bacterium AL-N5]NOK79663.1 peptidase S8 [Chloroflexi bacterium AL-W]NOK87578.1 peptidase S8 [Chloroflexi bacterium AL-N15]